VDVEGLIRGLVAEHHPLFEVGVHHGGTLDLLPVPGTEVAGKTDRLLQMSLYRGVYPKADKMVKRAVGDGSDYVGWTSNTPCRAH